MITITAVALACLWGAWAEVGRAAPRNASPIERWPEGTQVLPFENVEGVILVRAALHGANGRDTTGLLALDTGAGYLTVGHDLARRLGIADGIADRGSILSAPRALPRIELGAFQIDQVSPVLTVDMDVVTRVTDRPVLGLLGERLFSSFAVLIDYPGERTVLIPITEASQVVDDSSAAPESGADGRGPEASSRNAASHADAAAASRAALAGAVLPDAIPIPFRLAGDGKMLVRARVSNPRPRRYGDWLTLIVDTGATKCVLFEEALEERAPRASEWPALRGLAVPTLMGTSSTRLARIPSLQIAAAARSLEVEGVDVAVMRSQISGLLSRAVGEPVHGLLGYSFLKRYRVVIDFPHRVLWLDSLPVGWDDRPYEYSHVGLQLERKDGAARVLAVAEGSPAALAGVAPGDEIVSVNQRPASESDIASLTRSFEGPPGSRLLLAVRRGSVERTYSLVRRRLL